jgi:uncharacterized protein YkuJ
MNNPRDVANEVVRCVREQDIEGLVALFSAVNRRKFGPDINASRPKLMKVLAKTLRQIGDVTEVGELREAPSFEGAGGVVAYLREEGDEVFVVTLKKEGDDYVFDDINSPSVASYQSLKLIE